MRSFVCAVVGFVALLCASVTVQASTLVKVKAKGFVQCGVSEGLAGFSEPVDGVWHGIDVDLCRAVAAAIFGDPSKVNFTPLSAADRFTALAKGDIDILSRNSTWTIAHDIRDGVNFVGTYYYDNQGFMLPADLNIRSVLELSNAKICVGRGTTAVLNVQDFFADRNMEIELVEYDSHKVLQADYEAGKCHAYAADISRLYSARQSFAEPEKHIILQDSISKEPLGPAVQTGDEIWFDLVKWVMFALINAEELEVSSANVDQMRESGNSAVRRLLGLEGDFGSSLGLDREEYDGNDWAYNAIKAVGNYGEIYDRHLGPEGVVSIPRNANQLWSKGGLLYAPPIR
ncbi:MAG: amino acid ABC transporter substrate-binding protein [Rhizobiaceae bacterium]